MTDTPQHHHPLLIENPMAAQALTTALAHERAVARFKMFKHPQDAQAIAHFSVVRQAIRQEHGWFAELGETTVLITCRDPETHRVTDEMIINRKSAS